MSYGGFTHTVPYDFTHVGFVDGDAHLAEQMIKSDFSQSAGIRSNDMVLSDEKSSDRVLRIFFIDCNIDVALLAL